MNIAEMHIWFRQYAQQMGMQNVRAILPEQIDLVINTSISDTINQLITENIGLTNDRIITDNVKLGQINALRTLYKVSELEIGEGKAVVPVSGSEDLGLFRSIGFTKDYDVVIAGTHYDQDALLKDHSSGLDGIVAENPPSEREDWGCISIDVSVGDVIYLTCWGGNTSRRWGLVNSDNQIYARAEGNTDPTWDSTHFDERIQVTQDGKLYVNCKDDGYDDFSLTIYKNVPSGVIDEDIVDNTMYLKVSPKINGLYLVDLSIQYVKSNSSGKKTAYFPIRIIEDSMLADTMQDYVLKPRVRTPAAVVYNNQLDLYLGENYEHANGHLENEILNPSILRVSYIAKPAKVTYLSDVGGENIDCDLPESMHVDILKHAVDLYNISIQGGLHAAQQQQRNQNQEVARNTARPDNEGYQQ